MGETVRMRASAEKTTAFRPGQVAALDIGSSKVVCLIGRAEPGNLRVTRRRTSRIAGPASREL